MRGHRDIFETMRREILSGKYDGDKPLPSEAQLAVRFGCSRPTVSRAMLELRREGLVVTHQGAATKVSRFALNATGALGLLVPGTCYSEMFVAVCNGIEKIASRKGWDVIRGEIRSPHPSVRAREARELARQFSQEHVAGVFMQPLEFIRNYAMASRRLLDYLERSSIPVCLLDTDIVKPPDRSSYDIVCIDNVGAGLAIGRRLLETGARKIVFLRMEGAAPTVNDRLRGVASAVVEGVGTWSAAENELSCSPDDVKTLRRLLRKLRPDAIVCGTDKEAAKLMTSLEELSRSRTGAVRPSHVRVAGFDGDQVARERGFLTCRQPVEALAELAVETLLSRIRSPSLPPRTLSLHADLVEAASRRG